MVKLTKKQSEILDFIAEYSGENPYPPTFKEIAEKFKITIGTVQDHIVALQKKGYLERIPDIARGFKIIRNETQKANVNLIPLYGNVAAGEPIFANDNVQGYVTLERNKKGHHIHFALKVKGDSMIDAGIYDGDIVIVRKQDSADDGDIVIALLDDEATVKTLRNSKIKAYLEASNSRYKSIVDKPFTVIGKVIELRRQINGN
ncbi:MAG: transcriptional repressor LexA [Ignavibacteriaceae bacterium]|jgi:SOS regulatory protein LexA|nr:MAG: transcriptional repressor LexA [Chlorobiota bacterium]KXK04635.1 MAG: transcriptional repressor, LexA family [Chlorobi bacterium OLB4]MBV6399501.1 LexA repressor [Ignavibacteria bacterium]MCC6886655.1 transcriptional repressor LexA [Ignavibacteriales bacterium]MCE7953206.1 transcriptional repressor LexA [Chlorobi bacterium CHB7]MEB2329011.1 transcriptional repressor LexA [Ignavibacteriaceae bacterium]OQY76547.1 MAG: repressor LexA [Ignavibacteriales bacterium UTCHB1]RIK50074.1 MAG: r